MQKVSELKYERLSMDKAAPKKGIPDYTYKEGESL